ncbi:uncharacterized protein [Parasteatoda tepidariorum]|uniref:uncharacterized protein n=1 Tax=Parasteatoda tepidariorum TaxID=114398 RepID=UPI0039BCBB11
MKLQIISYFLRMQQQSSISTIDVQPVAVEKHPKYLGFVLDPEILSNKNIDHLVLKARKRLNILKYISGRDWGAEVSTLRSTYINLLVPILEYGFPIYSCASHTNFQKLERILLSAARIITGLRNSCPGDIILFEADLQPLSLRRSSCMVKYYSKLYSFGSQNGTSDLLTKWQRSQRLKRNSPFSQVFSSNITFGNVEQHFLRQSIDPAEGPSEVSFHTDLPVAVNKQNDHPAVLRQAALERIYTIPTEAVQIYTDGSKSEDNHTGSGIFIKTQMSEIKIQKRNPDHCSVFRSELIAIDDGLASILSLSIPKEI